jgi:hypothetical protein
MMMMIKEDEIGGVWEILEMDTNFWSETLKGTDLLGRPRCRWG